LFLGVLASGQTPPPSVDWRTKGVVGPVQNGGQTGNVVSLVAAEAISSTGALESGTYKAVNANWLQTCAKQCSGNPDITCYYKWVIARGGACSGVTTNCSCTPDIVVVNYQVVTPNNELELQSAVASAPVSAGIDAGDPAFQLYTGGVFSGPCGIQLDHLVLIVGYGTQGTTPYWILQNSWGTSWGVSGYMLLKRGNSTNSPGQCGIASSASFPEGVL